MYKLGVRNQRKLRAKRQPIRARYWLGVSHSGQSTGLESVKTKARLGVNQSKLLAKRHRIRARHWLGIIQSRKNMLALSQSEQSTSFESANQAKR